MNVAFLGLKSFDNVLQTFKKVNAKTLLIWCFQHNPTLGPLLFQARSELGEILSSCEFIDGASMVCVTGNLDLTCPIAEQPFYMLIETSGSK